MIKSKIDARERALELAVEWRKAMPNSLAETTESMAEKFAKFLIGDAELPETQSDTELVKAFLEVMNSELDKKCKPMPDYAEMLRTVQTGNAGVSAEIPCKSEAE
jgi:hypothetical protein